MGKMFRWVLLEFLTGLWLSLEEAQCGQETVVTSNTGGHIRCCIANTVETCVTTCLFNKTHLYEVPVGTDQNHDGYCADAVDKHLLPQCDKSTQDYRCKNSGNEKRFPITGAFNLSGPLDNQYACIWEKISVGEVTWKCCNCSHNCRKGEKNSSAATAITPSKNGQKSLSTPTVAKASSPSQGINKVTVSTSSVTQNAQNRGSDDQTTAAESAGQFTQMLLILFVLLASVFIIVAAILIIRKQKFSGRSEVSSGYEATARENHYELSGDGVPIYTELELTQRATPSNSTVYASVQPTGEAVDMGKRVVYSELDKISVAVSPVYSQPFEPETSAINTDYAEPFKPDTTNTATAQVPSHYYNIAAVDQQDDVYSLANAIPLSDPNVIYSQPNKPTK